MAIEKEVIVQNLENGQKKITFTKTDRDGTTLNIDRVVIAPEYEKTFYRQLKHDIFTEVKFCVQIDSETVNKSDDEYWELIFFPMFDRTRTEIPHGSVVDFEDSIVNGNLMIENGFVTEMSSNHLDPEYHSFQMPILYFAKIWLQNYIDEIRR